jgi:hypothetical protein
MGARGWPAGGFLGIRVKTWSIGGFTLTEYRYHVGTLVESVGITQLL